MAGKKTGGVPAAGVRRRAYVSTKRVRTSARGPQLFVRVRKQMGKGYSKLVHRTAINDLATQLRDVLDAGYNGDLCASIRTPGYLEIKIHPCHEDPQSITNSVEHWEDVLQRHMFRHHVVQFTFVSILWTGRFLSDELETFNASVGRAGLEFRRGLSANTPEWFSSLAGALDSAAREPAERESAARDSAAPVKTMVVEYDGPRPPANSLALGKLVTPNSDAKRHVVVENPHEGGGYALAPFLLGVAIVIGSALVPR